MAWETRGHRKYFYIGRRVNGRTMKEYYGSGAIAELASQLLEQRKAARRKERAALQAARERFATAQELMDQLSVAIAAAIHLQADLLLNAPAEEVAMPTEKTVSSQDILAKFRQLLGARATGDASVDQELRLILKQFPELWPQLGDLGEHAIGYWIELIGGNDELVKQAIRQKLKALRAELSASAHDPASKLLVERVVATWMQVTYADARYANAGDVGDKGFEFLARRQQQAQKQHLAALQAWRQWRQLAGSLPGFSAPAAETPKPAPASTELEPCILPFPLQAASA